jgi:hypothetical protein
MERNGSGRCRQKNLVERNVRNLRERLYRCFDDDPDPALKLYLVNITNRCYRGGFVYSFLTMVLGIWMFLGLPVQIH